MREEHNKKTQKNSKKILLITLCVILSLLLAILLLFAAIIVPKLDLIHRSTGDHTMSSSEYEEFLKRQQETADATGETLDPAQVVWGKPGLIELDANSFNILLIGQDRREGQERQRSDAMILCTFNVAKKTLTMTSFMRDLYVQIPGYSDNRINACYQIGGMSLLDKCLEKNFGIQVDKNVEIDFFGFMKTIDIVGGIDIELNSSEAKYLNRRGNWDVDNSTAGKWDLVPGMNHLTGEQALAYCRIRYIGNSDYERTERQRKVLNILIDKCKNLSASEMNDLLNQVLSMVTTDMNPYTEIPSYALKVFPILSDLKVITQRIPADGAFKSANIRGMSVLVPDIEKNTQLLKESMAE